MGTYAGRISIWALPGAEERPWLAATIAALARAYGTPEFQPHLTLYTGRLRTGASVEAVQASAEPLTCVVRGPAYTSEYTRTLFLELEADTLLLQARARLLEHCQPPENDPFQPHVSLVYGGMDETQRRAAAARLPVPFRMLHFASYAVIAVPERVTGAADVQRFRRIA